MNATHLLRVGLGLGLTTVACFTTDPFFFDNRKVDREYRWDDENPCDPLLQGELAEAEYNLKGGAPPSCHASVVPPEHREEGFIALADGRRVHYVFAHRSDAEATLVYSHGTSWHLARYWDRVEMLWEMGYQVLIYDYPGYGRSEGEPDEAGVFAAAAAVVEEVLPTMPHVDLSRVIFMGYSLGGAPTYELARRASEGELSVIPRGVMSESTFCSTDVFIQETSGLGIPGEFVTHARWDNCGRIAQLNPELPVMIIHGTDDDFVIPLHASELNRAATGKNVTLRWVDGANHSEVPVVGEQPYRQWIKDFIDESLAR